MTERPIVFHPAVEDDFASIYDYYEGFDPVLPSRFQVRLDELVETLQLFPESGAIVFESFRRLILKRFPYMAVYCVGDDRIDVLAVMDTRRDPAWIEATVSGRAQRP